MSSEACPFDTILPRTPYLVVPKMAIQAMPMGWRRRLAKLLDEAEAAGLITPAYFVLRSDSEFTATVPRDDEDPYGSIEAYRPLNDDPWANYRHATHETVRVICPTFCGAPTEPPDMEPRLT